MVNQFHLQAAAQRMAIWAEYVPSKANIADLPSRGSYELLDQLGGRRVGVPVVGIDDWMAPLHAWMGD